MRDRKNVESEGREETKETRPSKDISKAYKFTETQGVYTGLAQVFTMFFAYIYIMVPVYCFYGIAECVNEQVFEFCAFPWALSPLFVLPNSDMLMFVLSGCILL